MVNQMSPTVIQHYRRAVGNTFSVSVEVTGLSQPITEAHFSCKQSVNDAEYIFHKTLEDGVSVGSDGVIRFVAPSSDMQIPPGRYVYDCTIEYGEDVLTLVTGNIDVVQIPTVLGGDS